MPRLNNFFDGQQSATTPTLGSLARSVTGSTGSPEQITAGGGISPAGDPIEMIFVEGSGGAVNITANPQIAAGSTVGQELNLIGTSASNTVALENGDGLKLNGGIVLNNETIINLLWDGSLWIEMSRF